MPKISEQSAPNVQGYGPALDLDDYTVNFVTIRQTHSLAGLRPPESAGGLRLDLPFL